ncbi:MAG: class I SAM-dependent methyltransferase [bacterium]
MHLNEYEKMYRVEDRDWWFVSRRELVLSHLKRFLKVNRPVILDIGCGTGATARLLSEHGEVVGLDFSKLALEACEKRGIKNLLKGSATLIPLADESVDVIVATDIIEHLDDDSAALREFQRVLKKTGFAIITVPAFEFLWSEHDEALMHRRRYTAGLLRRRVAAAGLALKYHGYALSLLFPLALMRLLKKKKPKDAAPEAQHVDLPEFANRMLIRFQRMENRLFWFRSLPWGLSVVSIVEKKSD